MDKHRVGVERSLALHREVARRILVDPALVDVARARVNEWMQTGCVPDVYARAWRTILEGTPAEIASAVTLDDEATQALRQVSPFAGTIDPQTRWRILRGVSGQHEAKSA